MLMLGRCAGSAEIFGRWLTCVIVRDESSLRDRDADADGCKKKKKIMC